MPDLTADSFWREYEKASATHRRAMKTRIAVERELAQAFSDEVLERWNAAHRDEAACYEELKAAERVVWAKYKNT